MILWKKKDHKQGIIKDSFMCVLQNCFERVDDPYIRFFVDGKKERLMYQMSGDDSDVLCFKVFHHGTEMQSAKILDTFADQLLSGKHRRDYSIITTYDEPSQAYCCKVMPLFGEFERRLRELIYFTVVKAFGIEWFEKTFNDELKKTPELARLNDEKLVEGALTELTFSAMQTYLFDPFPDMTNEEAIRSIIAGRDYYSREEIIDIINQTEKKSLWKRFFSSQAELGDFPTLLEELRKKRNKVMHAKRFTREEMQETRKTLREANKKLEQAISILDKKYYDNTTIQNMVKAFSSMVLISCELEDHVKLFVESMASRMQSLQSVLSSVPIQNLQEATGMTKAIKEMQGTFSFPMIQTLKTIQEQQNPFVDSIQMKEIARLGKILTNTYLTGRPSEGANQTEE